MLILLKYEIGLVRYLRAAKVNIISPSSLINIYLFSKYKFKFYFIVQVDIKEFDFPENRLLKIQDQFEKLVNKKDHFLLTTAVDAYRSYLHVKFFEIFKITI